MPSYLSGQQMSIFVFPVAYYIIRLLMTLVFVITMMRAPSSVYNWKKIIMKHFKTQQFFHVLTVTLTEHEQCTILPLLSHGFFEIHESR